MKTVTRPPFGGMELSADEYLSLPVLIKTEFDQWFEANGIDPNDVVALIPRTKLVAIYLIDPKNPSGRHRRDIYQIQDV